jgi:hypothetical protein
MDINNNSFYMEPQSTANTSSPTKFPYNNTTFTESGHSLELDDTPGKERIRMQHRSGTFFEMHPDGKFVLKVIGPESYEITGGNKNLDIGGNLTVTVDGNYNMYVKKDYTLRVDGDYIEHFNGNVTKLGDNDSTYSHHAIKGDHSITATGDIILGTQSSFLGVDSGGDVVINGNLVVNGDIRGSQSLFVEGNVQAFKEVIGFLGIRSPKSLLVGTPAVAATLPESGVHIMVPFVDITASGIAITGPTAINGTTAINGATTINGAALINGILTTNDTVFIDALTFFAGHFHIADGQPTTPPIPIV